MTKHIFSDDFVTDINEESHIISGEEIKNFAGIIDDSNVVHDNPIGKNFVNDVIKNHIADFQKDGDSMVHVSTFSIINDIVYMTYYANTTSTAEDPEFHEARFVICPLNKKEQKQFFVLQSCGDVLDGKKIEKVYDTILMPFSDNVLFLLWTACADGNYYRFYRTYDIKNRTLSEVCVNKFVVGQVENDLSITGIKSALAANNIGWKKTYSDIGLMQKLSANIENGIRYFYSGIYSGDFNCIVKSKDLITWEYVAAPNFPNLSKWENATYVKDGKCYYFVRQQDNEKYGFLSCYDLESKTWAKPVLITDCQSRSDFIEYNGNLYLCHAPINREGIGFIRIDTTNLEKSTIQVVANFNQSIFYPFINYDHNKKDKIYISYTDNRKRIVLSYFLPEKYLK